MEQIEFSDFLTKCFNAPVDTKNCNHCQWINITEEDQQFVKRRTIFNDHACMLYGSRLYHKTNRRVHDDFIYPCEECNNDGNKYFQSTKGDLNETQYRAEVYY